MPEKAAHAEEKTKKKSTVLLKSQENTKPEVKKKSVKEGSASKGGSSEISLEAWNKMVADAAYFIAEHRGFSQGRCEEDWFEAERLMEKLIKPKK